MKSIPIKKPSARKSLCIFIKYLEVKKKTSYHRFGSAKSKSKAIKFVNKPWALKQKRKGNSKIDEHIKKSPYNLIMHHPQVVQSPIVNDYLKVKIDGHTEPQLVTKKIFQVSFRELNNNFVSATI